jgi:hypothetical protein
VAGGLDGIALALPAQFHLHLAEPDCHRRFLSRRSESPRGDAHAGWYSTLHNTCQCVMTYSPLVGDLPSAKWKMSGIVSAVPGDQLLPMMYLTCPRSHARFKPPPNEAWCWTNNYGIMSGRQRGTRVRPVHLTLRRCLRRNHEKSGSLQAM